MENFVEQIDTFEVNRLQNQVLFAETMANFASAVKSCNEIGIKNSELIEEIKKSEIISRNQLNS